MQQHVQALVAQVGEGVGGVDGKRREGGVDVVVEKFFQPSLFRGGALLWRLEEDFFPPQGGHDFGCPHAVFVAAHGGGDLAYAAQLLARAEPVETDFRNAGFKLLFEARHADFKELVEVVADYREKPEPFEDGKRRLGAQVEHPPVEGEPAELPVEVLVFAVLG